MLEDGLGLHCALLSRGLGSPQNRDMSNSADDTTEVGEKPILYTTIWRPREAFSPGAKVFYQA